MDDFELDREILIATFTEEARDLLQEMERLLLGLEEAPDDPERLRALFRAAHTLKGGAATVGFDGPRDLAHELEGLLDGMRSGRLRADAAVVTLLLGAVDTLRRAIADAAAGRPGDAAALAAIRARLVAAATGAAAPGPTPTSSEPALLAAAGSLRVATAKLDRMMDLAGELAISRGRLADLLEREELPAQERLVEAHRESDRLFQDLQELIMKARLVPLGPLFQQQVRTARDAASATGRRVRVVVEGADVEVDTAVAEQVRDPLTHLVRNAVDHGIESPEERAAAGKEPSGCITLRGFRDAGGIVVQVEDDGRGLDHARIAARAEAMGLVTDASRLPPAQASRLIFEPGLTTSEGVTALSGRGVGMDVVRRNVEGLRGTAEVDSAAGRGTTVTLRLPLTLAIIQGFRVECGVAVYVLPLDAVVECAELAAGAWSGEGAAGFVELRGQPLPCLALRELFAVPGRPPRRANVVVVRHADARVGLVVDQLLGESQTVIKPLGTMFRGVAGVSGSAILGDGRVALILDVAGLLRSRLRAGPAHAA